MIGFCLFVFIMISWIFVCVWLSQPLWHLGYVRFSRFIRISREFFFKPFSLRLHPAGANNWQSNPPLLMSKSKNGSVNTKPPSHPSRGGGEITCSLFHWGNYLGLWMASFRIGLQECQEGQRLSGSEKWNTAPGDSKPTGILGGCGKPSAARPLGRAAVWAAPARGRARRWRAARAARRLCLGASSWRRVGSY